MEKIRFYNNNNDEDFFNYIYDNIGSDIAIIARLDLLDLENQR